MVTSNADDLDHCIGLPLQWVSSIYPSPSNPLIFHLRRIQGNGYIRRRSTVMVTPPPPLKLYQKCISFITYTYLFLLLDPFF